MQGPDSLTGSSVPPHREKAAKRTGYQQESDTHGHGRIRGGPMRTLRLCRKASPRATSSRIFSPMPDQPSLPHARGQEICPVLANTSGRRSCKHGTHYGFKNALPTHGAGVIQGQRTD